MVIREIRAKANMNGFGAPIPINGVLFGGEEQAHKFVITAQGGATFSGSVSAKFLRYADNVTVPLVGSIEEDAATVTLIENCYARPGRFKLTVYVTEGESTTAIYCCMGTVDRTDGETTVDPNGEITLDVIDLINDINTTRASIPADYSALSAQVDEMGKQVADDLYLHETDTDAFYWRPNVRVNTQGSGYATSQTHYTGIYKNSDQDRVYIYPGTTIKAKTGYTMDYALRTAPTGGTKIESQRDIAAGTTITLQHAGYLWLSVTDGTSATSPDSAAKAVAKAGLEIDLVVYPINDTVLQNETDIAALDSRTQQLESALECGELFDDYTVGKSITTNVNVGATVDVNTLDDAPTFECAVVEVLAGDRYRLTGNALNQARLWAFTDDQYALISKSGSDAHETDLLLTAPADGYLIVNVVKASTHSLEKLVLYEDIAEDVKALKTKSEKDGSTGLSDLVTAQKEIAADWRFAYINVSGGMGLGSNHFIPGTATTWDAENTEDLDQKGVWMSDGVHPFKGTGVTEMYARTIAAQLAMIPPSYRNGVGETSPSLWAGRNMLWLGTSIPAGRDPEAGEGTGSTYPAMVRTLLGATGTNEARGASCVRINSSTGQYTGMKFAHFLRALTRTQAECEDIITNWANYRSYYSAHETLTTDEIAALRSHSFEQILLPYLNGTEDMPDLFVIDHGHNDVNPRGVDGLSDLWIEPTLEMIQSGILAEDTYMTANNYAHLKTALNNDLSGITDKAAFAASLNRNCFKGAMNFLITVILTYNPYARVIIVGDYN